MLVVLKKEKSTFLIVLLNCHYFENVFGKTNEAMKKHLPICAAREGITDNDQIITFLDDFKYLGDVLFSVYFDFEITNTGGTVFFLTQKCL